MVTAGRHEISDEIAALGVASDADEQHAISRKIAAWIGEIPVEALCAPSDWFRLSPYGATRLNVRNGFILAGLEHH